MDIFHNPTTKIPKKDEQILRVDFTQSELAGRKDHMPPERKAESMSITHVPSNK